MGEAAAEIKESSAQIDEASTQAISTASQTWVAFKSSGRYFLDKAALSGIAENKLRALRTISGRARPTFERLTKQWLFSQRVVFAVGLLPALPPIEWTTQNFPHETQFLAIERSDILTRGFHNPSTMVDNQAYFEINVGFDIITDPAATGQSVRHVLVVGWEVDRRYLVVPVFLALLVATGVSVGVGFATRNVATAAQVAGSLFGAIAIVLCYVMWRCSSGGGASAF